MNLGLDFRSMVWFVVVCEYKHLCRSWGYSGTDEHRRGPEIQRLLLLAAPRRRREVAERLTLPLDAAVGSNRSDEQAVHFLG